MGNEQQSATQTPASQEQRSSSSSPEVVRKPKVGEWVLYREHYGDRPAMVAHVAVEGALTLSVLGGNGQWFTRDRVAREIEGNDGGMLIVGKWRFYPTSARVPAVPDPPKPKE